MYLMKSLTALLVSSKPNVSNPVQRHIIYIPGLGDGYDVLRKLGLLLWRRPGVTITHVPMHWASPNETYEEKLARIERAIKTYDDRETILVGESAGGAMAIVALRRYREHINRVVTVCGMNQGAENVNPRLYRKNRAFKAAMSEVDTIIPTLSAREKAAALTIYSTADMTVRPKDTLIAGVKAYDLKIPGHMFVILVVLLIHYRLVVRGI